MKKIAVCIKIKPDLTLPLALNPLTGRPEPEYTVFEPDGCTLAALNLALTLREKNGAQVSAVIVGSVPDSVFFEELQATEISVEHIQVKEESIQELGAREIAMFLAAYFQTGLPEVIICGQAQKTASSGQVGPYLAQLLAVPHIAGVTRCLETDTAGFLSLERIVNGEWLETVKTPLPILLTVGPQKIGLPIVSLYDTIRAKSIPVRVIAGEDLAGIKTVITDHNMIKLLSRLPVPKPRPVYTPAANDPLERMRQLTTAGLQQKKGRVITASFEEQADLLVDYLLTNGWQMGGEDE